MDKHTDTFAESGIVPAVVNRRVDAVIPVQKSRQGQAEGSVPQPVERHATIFHDITQHVVHVHRSVNGQIPDFHCLHVLVIDGQAVCVNPVQQRGIVFLRRFEVGALAKLFLKQGDFKACEAFLCERFPGIRPVDIPHEYLDGLSVKRDMVSVHKQVICRFRTDDRDPEQALADQPERIDQIVEAVLQGIKFNLIDKRLVLVPAFRYNLSIFVRGKTHFHVGMRIHRLNDGLLQPGDVHIPVQFQQGRRVVDSRVEVGHALHIDALLNRGQRITGLQAKGLLLAFCEQVPRNLSDRAVHLQV